MLLITHDGTSDGATRERCCLCRAETPYWHASDVALCPYCADRSSAADLPSKKRLARKRACFRKIILKETKRHVLSIQARQTWRVAENQGAS